MNTDRKLVVAGNATIDRIVQAEVTTKGENREIVRLENPITRYSREFHVEDGPIVPGGKYRVREFLDEASARFLHWDQTGGCGYNSVAAINEMVDIRTHLELSYLDISIPTKDVIRDLRKKRIRSYFLFEREIPYNLIVGSGRDDKVVLKGPDLGRIRINADELESLDERIKGSDALLINNAKDGLFIDILLETMQRHRVGGYFAVTKSTPPNLVFTSYLQRGVCFFNYDELPSLSGMNENVLNESERLEFAKEQMFKMMKANKKFPIVITLSKEGAFYTQDGEMFHERLNDHYKAEVAKAIRSNPGSTLGAGDTFIGVTSAYHIARPEWNMGTVIRRGTTAALNHIGYRHELPNDAFVVTKVK